MSAQLLRKICVPNKTGHPTTKKWTVAATADDFLQMEKQSRKRVYGLLFAFLLGATSIFFAMDNPCFSKNESLADDLDLTDSDEAEWDWPKKRELYQSVFNRDLLDISLLAMISVLYAAVMMGFRPAKRLAEARWNLGANESEKMVESEEQVEAALSIYRRIYVCFSICLLTFILLRIEGIVSHYQVYSNPATIVVLQALMLLVMVETFFWMNMALFLSPEDKCPILTQNQESSSLTTEAV